MDLCSGGFPSIFKLCKAYLLAADCKFIFQTIFVPTLPRAVLIIHKWSFKVFSHTGVDAQPPTMNVTAFGADVLMDWSVALLFT